MKQVVLSNGFVALVDDCDYDTVSQYKWNAVKSRNYHYARASFKRKTLYMHRLIMGVLDDGIMVDHINRNGLDNRRANLRPCDHSSNGWNRRAQVNKSGYIGVYKSKRFVEDRFYGEVTYRGKKIRSRIFDSAVEAAIDRDRIAKEICGEFASLNFPGESRLNL